VQLQEYDSTKAPKYNALSYSWAIDRSHRKRLLKKHILIARVSLSVIARFAKSVLFDEKKPARKASAKKKKPWPTIRRRRGVREHDSNIESNTSKIQALEPSLHMDPWRCIFPILSVKEKPT